MREWIQRRNARVGVALSATAVALAVGALIGAARDSSGCTRLSGGWAALGSAAFLVAIAGAATGTRRRDGLGIEYLVATLVLAVGVALGLVLVATAASAIGEAC